MKKRVIIVGAGAAGMLAAGFAAKQHEVFLVERNEKPGRKLMITGKGRCNVTNNCMPDEFLRHVPVNSRFLYGALSRFAPVDTMTLMEKLGVPLKTERGRRVFPISDKAADVVDALKKFSAPAQFCVGRVKKLLFQDGAVKGVVLEDGREISADAVILSTGGTSYPTTGSTGDGYDFARQAGHTIVSPKASLVPIVTTEEWPSKVMGLSLRNVKLTVHKKKREVFSELGEMLFTHFGVSGPLVLSASSYLRDPKGSVLSIDLKPALSFQKLDARLQREFAAGSTQALSNIMRSLLPRKLIPICLFAAGVDGTKQGAQATKEDRKALIEVLKDLALHVHGFRPVEEAIITSGGVNVKEVDPKTMESKRVHGLYFAGEILDVDAHTGGYNLQIAFATGFAASHAI
mgnify:CR=1 FL=1